MEVTYGNGKLVLRFDEEKDILFSYWTLDQYIDDQDYRKLCLVYESQIIKYQPKNLLLNAVNAFYVVPVETQKWLSDKLTPLVEKYKTEKSAVIMSSDFITQLSIEQIVDESENKTTATLYFDDEKKAIEWLEEGDKIKAA